MRILITISALLFIQMTYAKEALICLPVIGSENYKNGTMFKIIKDGSLARLESMDNPDNYWDYEIYYYDRELGYRAVKRKPEKNGSTGKMFSIAIGGSLYVMKNFRDDNKIVAVATYANAFRNDNDFGFMRLSCKAN